MIGMMMAGALQQGIISFSGSYDLNRPLALALYFDGVLPPVSTLSLDELFIEEELFPVESLSYAIIVPLTTSAEEFFRSRGISDPVDNTAELDDGSWVSVREDFAVFSNNKDIAKISKTELDAIMSPKIQNAVIEIEVPGFTIKRLLEIQTEKQRKMTESMPWLDKLEDETSENEEDFVSKLAKIIELSNLWKDFFAADAERSMETIEQIDVFDIGLSYDMLKGLSLSTKIRLVKDSRIAQLAEKTRPLNISKFNNIPANALFASANGKAPILQDSTRGSIEDILKTVVPKIKDEEIRKSTENYLVAAIKSIDASEDSISYIETDKDGRAVFVAKEDSSDITVFTDTLAKYASLQNLLLSGIAPDQKVISFDTAAQTWRINFVEIFNIVKNIDSLDLEKDDLKELRNTLDTVMGSGYEIKFTTEGNSMTSVIKSTDSDYKVTSGTGGTGELLARANAIETVDGSSTLISALTVSPGPIAIKVVEMMAKISDDDELTSNVKELLETLPAANSHGIVGLTFVEDLSYRVNINMSAEEIKWLVSFFKALDNLPD
jgi:hypothetical protein